MAIHGMALHGQTIRPRTPEEHMPDPVAAVTPTETIHVDVRVVACDGGGGALGHPRVWLRIVDTQTMCPYCSRLYVLNPGAGNGHGH
jgi:uncharacterized Zn-finger protein